MEEENKIKFIGKTWIAYFDISGFKKYVEQEKGLKVLSKFYAVGYRELKKNKNLYGIFFSDLGIIFINNDIQNINSDQSITGLCEVLKIVTKLNKEFLIPSVEYENLGHIKFMTKCAIAFGDLNIMKLPELPNIEKQPLYGQGFIDAYESAEGISEHTMQIGEVRITYRKTSYFKDKLKELNKRHSLFKNLYKIGPTHAYFSWTGKADPSKELNKIFNKGKQKAQEAHKNEMDNMYKKQLDTYTDWIKG